MAVNVDVPLPEHWSRSNSSLILALGASLLQGPAVRVRESKLPALFATPAMVASYSSAAPFCAAGTAAKASVGALSALPASVPSRTILLLSTGQGSPAAAPLTTTSARL